MAQGCKSATLVQPQKKLHGHVYLLMDNTVISYGGDDLLGLLKPLSIQELFLQFVQFRNPDRLSCFLLRSVGIFQFTSMGAGLGH